jgi:SH3-like domain-containing protein
VRKLSILALPVLLACLSLPARGIEYQTVNAAAALYDTPNSTGTKLCIIRSDTPVEVVQIRENLAKVRDADGFMAWIEKRYLSPRRTVIVKAGQAAILQRPEESAPKVFLAERDVSLDYLETLPGGWIKVRHRDGEEGYARASEVWGF